MESGRGTVPGVRLRLFFAPRGLATRCLLFVFVLYLGLLPERVRVISIARLRTLLPVYLRPIDVIVFDGPY